MWLFTGFLMGLGLAWYLFAKGYIPQPRGAASETAAESSGPDAGTATEEVAPRSPDSKRPQYDFFTVLPEMEVVVPEQELSESVQPGPAGTAAAEPAASYLLQVGSFREVSDAEQMKARLALLGIVARVQTVTINDATWHRVRAGPVGSAREADEMRTRLADNDIDSLVLKDQ
jgi:cell division protein FtsN